LFSCRISLHISSMKISSKVVLPLRSNIHNKLFFLHNFEDTITKPLGYNSTTIIEWGVHGKEYNATHELSKSKSVIIQRQAKVHYITCLHPTTLLGVRGDHEFRYQFLMWLCFLMTSCMCKAFKFLFQFSTNL